MMNVDVHLRPMGIADTIVACWTSEESLNLVDLLGGSFLPSSISFMHIWKVALKCLGSVLV